MEEIFRASHLVLATISLTSQVKEPLWGSHHHLSLFTQEPGKLPESGFVDLLDPLWGALGSGFYLLTWAPSWGILDSVVSMSGQTLHLIVFKISEYSLSPLCSYSGTCISIWGTSPFGKQGIGYILHLFVVTLQGASCKVPGFSFNWQWVNDWSDSGFEKWTRDAHCRRLALVCWPPTFDLCWLNSSINALIACPPISSLGEPKAIRQDMLSTGPRVCHSSLIAHCSDYNHFVSTS